MKYNSHNYGNNKTSIEESQDIQINESAVTSFAFTLRKTKLPATQKDYVSKLSKIKDLGCIITDHVYEYEAGIHCHGVIQIPKDFNLIKLRTRGWRIQLDELYDYAGWLCYMTKQNILETISPPEDEQSEDTPPQIKMPKCKLF